MRAVLPRRLLSACRARAGYTCLYLCLPVPPDAPWPFCAQSRRPGQQVPALRARSSAALTMTDEEKSRRLNTEVNNGRLAKSP